jgi:hypothetical protein
MTEYILVKCSAQAEKFCFGEPTTAVRKPILNITKHEIIGSVSQNQRFRIT